VAPWSEWKHGLRAITQGLPLRVICECKQGLVEENTQHCWPSVVARMESRWKYGWGRGSLYRRAELVLRLAFWLRPAHVREAILGGSGAAILVRTWEERTACPIGRRACFDRRDGVLEPAKILTGRMNRWWKVVRLSTQRSAQVARQEIKRLLRSGLFILGRLIKIRSISVRQSVRCQEKE